MMPPLLLLADDPTVRSVVDDCRERPGRRVRGELPVAP